MDSLAKQIENDIFDFKWLKKEPRKIIRALEGANANVSPVPPIFPFVRVRCRLIYIGGKSWK